MDGGSQSLTEHRVLCSKLRLGGDHHSVEHHLLQPGPVVGVHPMARSGENVIAEETAAAGIAGSNDRPCSGGGDAGGSRFQSPHHPTVPSEMIIEMMPVVSERRTCMEANPRRWPPVPVSNALNTSLRWTSPHLSDSSALTRWTSEPGGGLSSTSQQSLALHVR